MGAHGTGGRSAVAVRRFSGCPPQRITRGQGDWLGLTLYDSFIRYLSPAYRRRTLSPLISGSGGDRQCSYRETGWVIRGK